MIENENQYRITSVWAERFAEAVGQQPAEEALSGIERAIRDGLASELQALRNQLAAYEYGQDPHEYTEPRSKDLEARAASIRRELEALHGCSVPMAQASVAPTTQCEPSGQRPAES